MNKYSHEHGAKIRPFPLKYSTIDLFSPFFARFFDINQHSLGVRRPIREISVIHCIYSFVKSIV